MALYDSTNLGKRTVPIIDGDRLWSMVWDDNSNKFTSIQYSDTFGDSWVDWYTFSVNDPIPTLWSLLRDTYGNFYYNSASQSAISAFQYASERLCRIDAVSKTIASVIEYVYATGRTVDTIATMASQNYASSPTYAGCLDWGFTEGPDGTIYVAQYGGSGTKYVPFLWMSENGGVTFTRKDWFFLGSENQGNPGTWHIHGICALSNGDLYVANGDIPRNVFRSTDKLATQPTRIALDGNFYWSFTDSTESPDGYYVSTDEPNMPNSIVRIDGNTATRVWSASGAQSGIPLYSIQAVGANEFWISGWEEVFQGNSTYQYLGRVTRQSSADPWVMAEVWKADPSDNSSTTGVNPRQLSKLAAQRAETRETFPYMFVSLISPFDLKAGYETPGSVLRVKRIEAVVVPPPTPTVGWQIYINGSWRNYNETPHVYLNGAWTPLDLRAMAFFSGRYIELSR